MNLSLNSKLSTLNYNMAYIELNNIQKSFADGNGGQRIVLDELSLEVEQGAFVAVTGVSGTGKTTLLNVLGTLLKPDGGTYLLGEEQIPYDDEARLLQIRNRQIGFMFQDYRLLPQFCTTNGYKRYFATVARNSFWRREKSCSPMPCPYYAS